MKANLKELTDVTRSQSSEPKIILWHPKKVENTKVI